MALLSRFMSETSQHARVPDIPVLHGWRAVSILLVMACHWLPMPPKMLGLNHTAGAMGMALFFTLSGFLIVSFLYAGEPLNTFLVKRVARILPLAWLAMAILTIWRPHDQETVLRNFLFFSNLPPASLLEGGSHLWSLCLEMQFYLLAALLCFAFGRIGGLYAIPLLGLAVTIARVAAHEPISIVTWHRLDEILAGGTLALIYNGRLGSRSWLGKIPTWPMLLLLIVASNPLSGPIQYCRPYAAALLVGSSLLGAPAILQYALTIRPMRWIAEISYALYVIHGVLTDSWLGSEPGKYLKRPLLVLATFCLAYLSTRYYEQPIGRMVRRLSKRSAGRHAARYSV